MKNTEWIIWIKKDVPFFQSEYFSLGEVWRFNADMNNPHPAPFPEEMVERCVLATTKVGDLVYDPFMGSGTTAKMATLLKRNYIGSEISKEYCEIANKRIKGTTKPLF